MGKITRSIYTTTEVWQQIQDHASAEGVSASAVISRAVHEYLQRDFMRSSWDTMPDDDWYDERRFYTYSQDKKGHSVTARVAIPKNIGGQIKRLVDSGVFPEVRSVGDYYRNAIFHWTHKITGWIEDDELVSELSWHHLAMEDETIRQGRKDFEAILEGMEKNLDEFLRERDYAHMDAYLNRREEMSGIIPEVYVEQYGQLIRKYRNKLGLAREGKLEYLE